MIATAAGVVAAGAVVAYAKASHRVTLSVDGTSTTVSTFADDVAGVLEEEGISVASRDLVAPDASTSLHDGDTVVVRYARPVTVTVDGEKRTYWTTERTVSGALLAIGLRDTGARLTASRSQAIGRQGISFALTTPKKVIVRADGERSKVTSTADTVAALLAELGIDVDGNDRVRPKPDTRFEAGDTVVVTRVTVKTKTVTEAIRHQVVTVSTSDLYKDQSRVVKAGSDGKKRITYKVTYVDGKETGRKVVKTVRLTEPVTEKREVGTKARPASSSSGGSAGGAASGLNWAALADCESGGNPKAVNPAGYYGLYQFSLSTWAAVGGSGNPIDASSSEQTLRAQILYNRSGAGQWPNCGKYLFT